MKRYDMIAVTRCGEGWQELQEEPEGEWVSYDEASAQIERMRVALQYIHDWSEAYPLGFADGMFDEPDMAEVQRRLGDELLTRLSAHNFRHVLNGIKAHVRAALEEK